MSVLLLWLLQNRVYHRRHSDQWGANHLKRSDTENRAMTAEQFM